MYRKSTRWLALFLALLTCASFMTLPVLAAEEAETQEVWDDAAAVFLPEEDAPLVNVIEPEEPEAPAEETAGPEETAEPESPAGPEETSEPEIPAEPREATAPAEETAEPAVMVPPAEEIVADAEEEIFQGVEPAAAVLVTEPEEGDAADEPDVDGAGEGPFKISYYNGKTLLAEEEVAKDKAPANAPTAAGGAAIKAWVDKDGKLVTLSELKVEADASYYAWFMPKLKTAEHSRYINGTGNARFSPTSPLTRAQAATILYQLLDSTQAGPYNSTFKDVADSAWYAAAVKTLASVGVVNGYTDGTFRPDRSVTRAEFVTMLVNLTGATGSKASFTDVSAKHWARASILAATSQGWVNGYAVSGNTYEFRPNNNITRAEAVVVMNRVLGRSADKDTLATGKGILHYVDVKTADWWYGDVMEASIGHTYTKSGATEKWSKFNVESIGLEPGLRKVGSSYVYVDSNRQLTAVTAGINKIGNGYYYAASAGYAIDADLSTKANTVVFASGAADQKLSNGFNRIGTALFYWTTSKKAPTAVKAGLNTIAGKTYWADAAGYIIRNDFGKGVVTLNGKKYLSDGACAIITSGTGCATGKEASKPTTIDLKNHTVEFDGAMYYLNSDYTVAINTWKDYLYFGSNGKYTSGDATLDKFVYNAVKGFINNTALTQEQKLLKAFYYLRGGSGEKWTDSGFGYRNTNQGYIQGRYNGQKQYTWQIDCALYMFREKRGMCYHWAAAYMFLARRLGFQAYLVVGTINGSLHCWNQIKWSGKWHISDVELEWGWIAGYYRPGSHIYHNLFNETLSSEKVSSYTNKINYTYKVAS